MKGLQLLLQSLGIKIEPAQVEAAFQRGKDALPKIAASFDDLNARLLRIETKLDGLIAWREAMDAATDESQVEEIRRRNLLENGSAHRA